MPSSWGYLLPAQVVMANQPSMPDCSALIVPPATPQKTGRLDITVHIQQSRVVKAAVALIMAAHPAAIATPKRYALPHVRNVMMAISPVMVAEAAEGMIKLMKQNQPTAWNAAGCFISGTDYACMSL